MCVSECSDRAGKESKEYVFGCYSSPLGGGIRTGLTARNEFTRLDLPETISLCGLHTFRVATCPPPPGLSSPHTATGDGQWNTEHSFIGHMLFIYFYLAPVAFFSLSLCLGLCLTPSCFSVLFTPPPISPILFSSHAATNENEITFYRPHSVFFVSSGWSLCLY